MKKLAIFAAAVSALAMTASANAATIYNLNQTVGAGSAVGTITTDDSLGVLGTANITGWNITINDGVGSFVLTQANSQQVLFGASVTATATGLFFDYSNAGTSFLLFQNPSAGSSINYFCLQTNGCYNPPVAGQGLRVDGVLLNTALQGNLQFASTGVAGVPEPATWAMMLLGFGAVGFTMRRRSTATTRVRYA